MTEIKDIANLFDRPREAEDWLRKLTTPEGTIIWGINCREPVKIGELFNGLANHNGKQPYSTKRLATYVHRQLFSEIRESDPNEPSQSLNFAVRSKHGSLDYQDRKDYGKPYKNRIYDK